MCLVAAAVFKTVVDASNAPGWVRFLPSPLVIHQLMGELVLGAAPIHFFEEKTTFQRREKRGLTFEVAHLIEIASQS